MVAAMVVERNIVLQSFQRQVRLRIDHTKRQIVTDPSGFESNSSWPSVVPSRVWISLAGSQTFGRSSVRSDICREWDRCLHGLESAGAVLLSPYSAVPLKRHLFLLVASSTPPIRFLRLCFTTTMITCLAPRSRESNVDAC
jgi:hypothetical protein